MIMRALLLAAVLATPVFAAPVLDTPVKDQWWADGRAALEARLKVVNRPKRAKNVILMVGDGMGISTITAARIFDGQRPIDGRAPSSGEENSLAWDRMTNTALVKTYNSNAQVPDSAGTASSFNTGVKTRIGVINFGADQGPEACKTPEKLPRTLAEMARANGMGLGIVTTTRITHATPAAVYGHVPSRDWEGADRAYPAAARASGCPDLAAQLVAFKGGFDVALGGGLARFLPLGKGGIRDDGRNLIEEWSKASNGRFVGDAKGLRTLASRDTAPVLGLFNADHISFEHDRKDEAEPGLPEMARFALAKLEAGAKARGGKGYYLMIEGGRIDHAHHGSNPYRALKEAQMFSATVAEVLKTVNLDDTLVLVTADHSHVLTIAGYPERGNDILGYIKPPKSGGEGDGGLSPEGYALDDRGQPMTTLSYANGPFVSRGLSRTLPPNDPNYLAIKTYGTGSESHGGEDVALFGEGPRADLVRGVMEQNLIFHIMVEALGWR
jgi:alkaline phosphatase